LIFKGLLPHNIPLLYSIIPTSQLLHDSHVGNVEAKVLESGLLKHGNIPNA
jgi:hypothetical protein